MLRRPCVGVVLLRAEWFDSVVALPQLSDAVDADVRALADALAGSFELAGLWVVNSAAALERAERALLGSRLDLVVLAFQVWAEDWYLMPLLRAIGDTPLAVWCYMPQPRPPRPASFIEVLRSSGAVGTLEGLGTLRNLGANFSFTLGAPSSPRVLADLGRAARAAAVRTDLRRARFGLLPYRNEQMQSNFVDEFRLLTELGPKVEYLSVGQLAQRAAAVRQSELDAWLADLRLRYPVRGVSEATLAMAARASLGLAHLASEWHLDVLSFNDIAPELHEVLGLRPCLYPELFSDAGTLLGLEGDLGAATALFVLNRLTGSATLFGEIWFWDEPDNLVVLGHAGPQNPALAADGHAWISHDYEFAGSDRTEGAQLQFVARPGQVTLFQVRATPLGWQALATRGEALASEPWVEGYPHAVVQLQVPVSEFFHRAAEAGSTQHWGLAYGDALDDLAMLCTLLGVPLEAMGSPAAA